VFNSSGAKILVKSILKKFLKDQEGATAIEYCMIGAAMCICLIFVMPFITTALTANFSKLGSSLRTF
jgi:pilus assembly protein Flp/PilA